MKRPLIVVLLLCIALSVRAGAQEISGDKAQCRTTWDDRYLYVSLQVDCSDIVASHKAPNAEITGDDCVFLYLQTDNQRLDSPTPSTFCMAVSAAGGAQFMAGDNTGGLAPVAVHTFKYGTSVQGTINNSDDIDTGYMVEMALPWAVMNAEPPKFGDMMGFNIIIRRHGWKPDGFISLSSRVKSEASVLKPSEWGSIVFTTFAFVARSEADKVLSIRNIVRPPVINGRIEDKEWPKNSAFTIELPLPPGFVYEAKFPIQRMVLSPYYYHWQRDPKKPAKYASLVAWDGGVALQNFPSTGTGPWFSSDRIQWHKEQAEEALAAGIDVLLPVYRGDAISKANYAAKGLDCLVAALQELRAEGKSYPLVGMWFDLGSLRGFFASQPQRSSEEVQRSLYGMVRDFYERVPPDFRAFAQTGKPGPGRMGALLVIAGSAGVPPLDGDIITYVNERFFRDFGTPIIWVASEGSIEQEAQADGCMWPGGPDAKPAGESRISACLVSPGYDDCAVVKDGPVIRSREGGKVYADGWNSAATLGVHWVVCDSWNDFEHATEICSSREYGRSYVEATSAGVKKVLGREKVRSQYVRCSVPEIIAPLSVAQAELVIRNVGRVAWKKSEGCALSYRWYKDGRYISESKLKRALDEDVLLGDCVSVAIGVATIDDQGAALTEGRYEVRFELVRQIDNKWFSTLGDQPLIVPVQVGQPPDYKVGYVSCDAPVLAAAGQTYRVKLRVRNDGAKVWPKGTTRLGCELVRYSHDTHDGTGEFRETVPITTMMGVLNSDCKPGEIATYNIAVGLRGADKSPVPLSPANAEWGYKLVFDVNDGQQSLSKLGVPKLERTIAVYESDYGARIIDSNVPPKLVAGQSYDVKVVIRNNGALTWNRKLTGLGYHWYHADGRLMLWEGIQSPLEVDVRPNWPIVVRAKIKAPEYDGRYVLVWDMVVEGQWLSSLPLTRGGDILTVPVEVSGGRLEFVNLDVLCDVSAASPDTARASGAFDANGTSFPAEYFPPDGAAPQDSKCACPVGYNWVQGDAVEGLISFVFADKSPGAKNAISCQGQSVPLEGAGYKALYVVMASSAGNKSVDFGIEYADGIETCKATVSDWSEGPSEGEEVAICTRHAHSASGDIVGARRYMYSRHIPLAASRTVKSIRLPSDPDVKIAALTLERSSLPGGATAAQARP